jgi:hypothetical protein
MARFIPLELKSMGLDTKNIQLLRALVDTSSPTALVVVEVAAGFPSHRYSFKIDRATGKMIDLPAPWMEVELQSDNVPGSILARIDILTNGTVSPTVVANNHWVQSLQEPKPNAQSKVSPITMPVITPSVQPQPQVEPTMTTIAGANTVYIKSDVVPAAAVLPSPTPPQTPQSTPTHPPPAPPTAPPPAIEDLTRPYYRICHILIQMTEAGLKSDKRWLIILGIKLKEAVRQWIDGLYQAVGVTDEDVEKVYAAEESNAQNQSN